MFKSVAADRPYPATGLTTRGWREVRTRYVPISELVATQDHLKITALAPDFRGSHSGDPLVHVVKHEGVFYLEDGHHRVVREALAGASHVNARVLDVTGRAPAPVAAAVEPDPFVGVPGLVYVENKGYRSVHLARALQETGHTVDWHRWSPGTSDMENRPVQYKDAS